MKPYREARAEWHRQYLRAVMSEAGGKASRAAQIAGINRTDFYNVLKRYGVAPTYNNPRLNRGNAAWQSLGDHHASSP